MKILGLLFALLAAGVIGAGFGMWIAGDRSPCGCVPEMDETDEAGA